MTEDGSPSRAEPRAWLEARRETAPAYRDEPTSSWYVGRFSDVWSLLVDPRLGARSQETLLRTMTSDERRQCADVAAFVDRWPVFLDPPRHTYVRRLLLPGFAAEEIERLGPAVYDNAQRAMTRELGASETFEQVVRPAILAGLAMLLGLEASAITAVSTWSRKIISFMSDTAFDEDRVREARTAVDELTAFVATLSRAPDPVPILRSLRAAVRTGTLTDEDVAAVVAQLITGAVEPTTAVIATAIERLSSAPSLHSLLRVDRPAFFAEAIRLTTPFHFAPRQALTDLDVGDSRIERGDRVVLVLSAANFDHRRFDSPDAFRIDRGEPQHVAFGRGRHACIGAGMATITAGAVVDALEPWLLLDHAIRPEWSDTLGMRIVQGFAAA